MSCAGFIDALSLEKPLVVGHSLGGAVALALALDHPDKVSGLALLSPVTREAKSAPPEFSALAIRSPLRRKLLAYTTAVPMSLKYAPRTLAFVFGPQATPADYVVAGGGLLGLRPSHFEATSTDFVALEGELRRYEARLEEIDVPIGVLFGTADNVIRHEDHALPLAGRVKGLDLELVDGIGHMLQFVATDRVEAFIRRAAARAFADQRCGRTPQAASAAQPYARPPSENVRPSWSGSSDISSLRSRRAVAIDFPSFPGQLAISRLTEPC